MSPSSGETSPTLPPDVLLDKSIQQELPAQVALPVEFPLPHHVENPLPVKDSLLSKVRLPQLPARQDLQEVLEPLPPSLMLVDKKSILPKRAVSTRLVE